MKTIEEAAKEYAETYVSITGYDKFDAPYLTRFEHNSDVELAFEEGVEFAQRWIPVEEELPETENEANGLSKVCICKGEEMADEFAAYYDEFAENWKIYPIGLMTTVTHWRPIELK